MKKILIVLFILFAFIIFIPGILYVGGWALLAIGMTSYAKNIDTVLSNARIINKCYAEYKGDIYYYRKSNTAPYLKKLDTNPSEFQVMYSSDPMRCYAKDSIHVYEGGMTMSGKDPSTFIPD